MSERRAFRRNGSSVELECWIGGEAVSALVRNLSIGGALIEVAGRQAAVGEIVMLKIVGLTSLVGNVRWVEGDQVGVIFKTELHPSVVSYLGFDPDENRPEAAA